MDDDPSPSEFTVGDTVTVRVSVRNIGNAAAGRTRLAYFIGRTSGHRFDTDSVSSLAPDERGSESARYTFTDDDVGTQYFVLEADHDYEVQESDEINNTAVIGPFEVLPKQPIHVPPDPQPPDIISPGCSPTSVETGQGVSCRPNLGGGTPSEYLWAALGGNPEGARTTTFSTYWTTPGDRRIILEVCNDGGCDVGEQSIRVSAPTSPPPDIISLGCSPSTVVTGQIISCRPNLGGGAPSEYLWAALGGHPEGARSTTFSTYWASPGNKRIILEVCNDGGCAMGEPGHSRSGASCTGAVRQTIHA